MKAFFKKFSLFGQPRESEKSDPKQKCREWNRSINREVRKVDRDMDGMTRSERTTVTEIKKLAASGQMGSVKILAKELVHLRKARERLLLSKTQLKSVSNQLTQQASMAKLSNAFQSSAEVMHAMNAIVNVPEMHDVMMKMGKEMENMGLVEGLMADGIDDALGGSVEMEEETELEINKLMEELAIDNITLVPSAGRQKMAGAAAVKASVGPSNAM